MNGSKLIDLSEVAVEGGILALSLLEIAAKYWAGVAGVVTLLPPGRCPCGHSGFGRGSSWSDLFIFIWFGFMNEDEDLCIARP